MNMRKYRKILKIVAIVCIVAFAFQSVTLGKFTGYRTTKSYSFQNSFSDEDNREALEDIKSISQEFVSRGNIIEDVSLYFGEITPGNIEVDIYAEDGEKLAGEILNLSEYTGNTWNKIGLSSNRLIRGNKYRIVLYGNQELKTFSVVHGDIPAIFGECRIDNEKIAEEKGSLAVGIQFGYQYFSLNNIIEMVLNILFTTLLCLALCFSVCKVEILYKEYKEKLNKYSVLYAIYFSLSFVQFFNPLDFLRNKLTEYDRVMGAGVLAGVDVSKRIHNFQYWFLFLAAAFVLFLGLSNYLLQKEKSTECQKAENYLNDFMILANCSLVFKYITYFQNIQELQSFYRFSDYVIFVVIMVTISYMVFHLDQKIASEDFAKLEIVLAMLSLPAAVFIGGEWGEGRIWIGVYSAIAVTSILGLRAVKSTERKVSVFLTHMLKIVAVIPFFESVYIEMVHILNQHLVFIAHPAKYFKIGIFLLLAFAVAYSLYFTKEKSCKNWKRWTFFWIILGISSLSVQIPISSVYTLDLFEDANYSILISDFLNYGKIPLLQHYGGHMMTSVWEGILYGVINQDFAGAAVSPYASMITPLLVLLFYSFLKKIYREDMAIAITLLFPFYDFWSYYGMGMLVCLAVMAYIKKPAYSRAWMIWAAFIWCAVYRLDMGYAFGSAMFISLVIYIFAEKKWKMLKEFSVTGILWGIVLGGAWLILCMWKGISPLSRLTEFLKISLSNQNWAYQGIGDNSQMIFSWAYFVIPFLMILSLIYIIFSKKAKKYMGAECWILLLILGWSYFGNFSRGLVRHSLAEASSREVIFWSAYPVLAAILCFNRKNKKLFLPVFMVLILCNTMLAKSDGFAGKTIADFSASKPAGSIESWTKGRFDEEKYQDRKMEQTKKAEAGEEITLEEKAPDEFMTYWEEVKWKQEKVNRVQVEENQEEYIEKYRTVLDTLLDEKDTFVDFMNKTVLYSVLGREDPVYVSQSPLQLAGEFSQEQFIKEIEGVSVVLMPSTAENDEISRSLDGISNIYRNYKVSEYVYQKHIPLCQYDQDYTVWCLKEDYNKYRKKIKKLIRKNQLQNVITLIEYGYDGPIEEKDADGKVIYNYRGTLHNYSVGKLPGIWAECDNEKANTNQIVCTMEKEDDSCLFVFDEKNADQKGNYLKITAGYKENRAENNNDANEQMDAVVIMGTYENGKFIEKYKYQMTVEAGVHDYLIRCSADYYWYSGEINAVKIEKEEPLHNLKLQILCGD